MRHIFFFFFFAAVLRLCAACQSPYLGGRVGGMVPEAMARYYGQSMFRQPMIPTYVPPPGVAMMNHDGPTWDANDPLSYRIVNDSGKFGRCFLGARELPAADRGAVMWQPLRTRGGVRPIRVIPPGSFVSDQLDEPGTFNLRCQLFTVGRDGTLRLVLEDLYRFQTNSEGGRTLYLHNIRHPVHGLPMN